MIPGYSKESNISNGIISASRKWIDGSNETHWHEFYEIEYVISGQGTYCINGRIFPMESGMLYFMTPVDFHSVHPERAEIINVMFSENLIAPSCLAPFTYHSSPKALPVSAEMQSFFMTLLEEVIACQEDPTYAASLIECLLLKLSRSLLSDKADSWNNTAQKIHFYIINHFRERVTLEDVAGYVGLTPAYVSAVFKKEINKNFKKYLNDLRFAYARRLLQYTNLSVTQVCGESGFDDYPNFIRRFKEHFGMTPTQLRGESLPHTFSP